MKRKRILAMLLAVASCLSLAVSASAANTTNRKATDFKDYDRTAWYAEAVSAAVDNGLLYGKSSAIIDPNGDMTRAEMAAIINRSFGCYKTADISQYKDVSKDKWYYKDIALATQMGTYNGRSSSAMAPDAPITRQETMTVVPRALELDYDSYSKTGLSQFADCNKFSAWALPYVRAMVGANYIHGRTKELAPQDNITRAEFAQIFHNIIGTYITAKGSYDKDIKGSVLIRTDDVTLQNMTVDGDLIIGCGAADGKITLDNVTVKGRLLVWGGGTKAVYCNNGTNIPNLVLPEEPECQIGKHGCMRRSYLKEHRPVLYANLLTSGTLHRHLAEIDQACNERMEIIVSDMAKQEDVTEALKAADQMEWVRRMNSIRSRAEEIVLTELVYE